MIESKEDLAAFLAVKAEKQAVGFVCPLVTAEEVRAKLDEAERQRMIAILREEELRKVAERKQEELAAALDTVTAPYAAAFDAIAMPEGAAEVGRLMDVADDMAQDADECWSADQELFRADSLGELIDSNDLEVGRVVWVGIKSYPKPSRLCDADDIITMMGERADEIAGEWADNYPDVSADEKAELNTLLSAWIAKCCSPTFFEVHSIKEYTITADDLS